MKKLKIAVQPEINTSEDEVYCHHSCRYYSLSGDGKTLTCSLFGPSWSAEKLAEKTSDEPGKEAGKNAESKFKRLGSCRDSPSCEIR